MTDSRATKPERAVQPKFSIATVAGTLLLLAAIALFDRWLGTMADRQELGWRSARLQFEPTRLDGDQMGPFRLAGAWTVTSDDLRFGGVSAVAFDRGRLLALTDSGVVVRFTPPGPRMSAAAVGELPGGPASPGFKRNRDSEAMVRDPGGGGWWIAFENRNELWLYDADFRRALRRVRLGDGGWRANRGVEGIAADGEGLLLFSERGDSALHVRGNLARSIRITDYRGRISDAVALGPGRYLAIERRLTPLGFRNALVTVERSGAGLRFGRRIALPLGPLDNLEAIAIERLPGGKRRLWLMTDDNFQRPLRTLLVALDMPAGQRLQKR